MLCSFGVVPTNGPGYPGVNQPRLGNVSQRAVVGSRPVYGIANASVGNDLLRHAIAAGPQQQHVKGQIRPEVSPQKLAREDRRVGIAHRDCSCMHFVAEQLKLATIFLRYLLHGDGDRHALQRAPNVVRFDNLIPIGTNHEGSTAGDLIEQPFALQAANGLANRCAADAQLTGQRGFGDALLGLKVRGEQTLSDFLIRDLTQ